MTDTSKEAVERYGLIGTTRPFPKFAMVQYPDGDWVDYDDYAALLSERDALRAQLKAARDEALEEAANAVEWRY